MYNIKAILLPKNTTNNNNIENQQNNINIGIIIQISISVI